MPADPKASAGARAERKAFRDYLRRQIKSDSVFDDPQAALEAVLTWVLKRQERYDKATGGLGRKLPRRK
jgi:hypothetical protein